MSIARFSVQYTIEGSVDIELPSDASEAEINKAAREAVRDEYRKARGGMPGELLIGDHENSGETS